MAFTQAAVNHFLQPFPKGAQFGECEFTGRKRPPTPQGERSL